MVVLTLLRAMTTITGVTLGEVRVTVTPGEQAGGVTGFAHAGADAADTEERRLWAEHYQRHPDNIAGPA